MPIRRRVQSPPEDASQNLLAELLKAPTAEARLRPVELRSLKAQRQMVLAPYPLRTWFDRALSIGERLLGILVLAFFGWWLIDGYGRDWWHARQVAQQAAQAPQVSQALVPTAPPTVESAPTAQAYPELGVSLPVVEDRWTRPGVTFDYLVPARTFIAPPPTPVAPPPAPPRDMRPTQVIAPVIGLDSGIVEVFVQDGAWQVADYAVGYHNGTGVVGQSNMVLAGHKGTRGAVFRRLEEIKAGDDIFVVADGERFQYRVRTTTRVWPNQVDVLFPTAQAQLTMLTCTNWDTQRFLVIADFVGPVAGPAAAGGN